MFILPHLKGLTAGNIGSAAFKSASLDLKFADNKSLTDAITGSNLVTFTRASSGMFVDSAGVLQTAVTDVPRFDHNPTTGESLGLLVEEQRTNLLLQSEDFSNVAWVVNAATVTTNTQTAPNGTLTADTFSPTSGTSSLHQIITCLASTVYTWTFYIKLGTMAAADFRFAVRDDSNGAFIATDIVPNVTPVTTEWRRVTYTFTTPVGCVLVRPYPYRFTPATYGTTVHLWGAQLEAGAFPTSYIPTTTAAVTRSADVASITGSAFTSFYNQSQLTLYLDLIRSYSGNFSAFFNFASLHDGTASNSLALYATQNNQNVTNYGIQSGGVVQNDFVARPTNFPGPNLIAQALATNSSMFAVNGVLTTEDTSITMPVGINQLRIGSSITGLAQWGGTIRRLTFWPQRLANSTLQNITT